MLSHIWAHIAKVTVKKVKVKRIKVKKVKVKKVKVKKVKVKKVKKVKVNIWAHHGPVNGVNMGHDMAHIRAANPTQWEKFKN